MANAVQACSQIWLRIDTVKTPKNVYRRFVEFEERAAAIYLQLASHFSQDPQLSSFWLDMAMHEKEHAGLLQFCLRDGLFAFDLPDSTEIQKLVGFFKRLEKRAGDPKLTLEEAFTLAIEMETSEITLSTVTSQQRYTARCTCCEERLRHLCPTTSMTWLWRHGSSASEIMTCRN